VLIGFSVGVIPATAGRIVATSFFAIRDTRTPMAFAITRIVVGAVLSAGFLFVVPRFLNPELFAGNPLIRVAGLSLGGSLAFWLEYALLYSAFEQRVGPPDSEPGFGVRLAACVAVASAAGIVLRLTLNPEAVWVFRLGVLAGFGIVFLILAEMFRISELPAMLGRLRRR
jgi:putative peptidoglycan lipid II flippase